MTYVGVLCAVLTGLVLTVSSVSKVRGLRAFAAFAASLPAFGVPRRLARPVAGGVTAAETAVAIGLAASPLVGVGFATAALLSAAVLFTVLTGAVVTALRRPGRAACNCFGRGAEPLGPTHVVRNLLLTAAAVTGAATVTPEPGHPAGLTVAAATGALLAGLVVRWDDLTYLLRPTGPSGQADLSGR
ncbi:MauE/DoxX family redox-associated membrane protein [Micromonospora zingiberis]